MTTCNVNSHHFLFLTWTVDKVIYCCEETNILQHDHGYLIITTATVGSAIASLREGVRIHVALTRPGPVQNQATSVQISRLDSSRSKAGPVR